MNVTFGKTGFIKFDLKCIFFCPDEDDKNARYSRRLRYHDVSRYSV